MTVVPTRPDEHAPTRTVRFGRRSSRGVLLGLSAPRLAAFGAAFVWSTSGQVDGDYEYIDEDFSADDATAGWAQSGVPIGGLALCRLLLSKPDMILLDEPTNHLDAESVAWLERYLKDYTGTVVAVTHDRYFLDNVAGWILELDRGHGIPWEGNYSSWLEQKEARLKIEEASEKARKRAMEHELEWVRSNPKGRQAKSKARLKQFEELSSAEYQKRNETNEIYIPPGPRLGDVVLEVDNLKKGFGDKLLIDGLSFQLPPGGIVGVIGDIVAQADVEPARRDHGLRLERGHPVHLQERVVRPQRKCVGGIFLRGGIDTRGKHKHADESVHGRMVARWASGGNSRLYLTESRASILPGLGPARARRPPRGDQVLAPPLPCRRVISERRNTLLKRSWHADETCSISVELTRRIVTCPSARIEAWRFAPRT